MKNMMDNITELNILEINESKEMLVDFLSIARNNVTQVNHMRQITEDQSEEVKVGYLAQFDCECGGS